MSVSPGPEELNHILEDHVRSDVIKEEFRQLCDIAWETNTVILAVKNHNGKYRSGLDEFYIPN